MKFLELKSTPLDYQELCFKLCLLKKIISEKVV